MLLCVPYFLRSTLSRIVTDGALNRFVQSDEEDDNASITSADRNSGSRQTSPQPPTSTSRAQSPSSYSRHGSPSSRAGTPNPGSGSALLAKRATSPSLQRTSSSSSSSRGTSPGPSSLSGGGSSKRKRTGGEGGAEDEAKRRKNGGGKAKSPSPGGVEGLITKEDLVSFLKSRPNQSGTTKDVLVHFRKALKNDARNKTAISGLIKSVADLVGGNLVLKAGL